MTDDLELLKRDWQKKEFNVPKLSYDEIHKMIWKKSSSIVKWILIISVLEFTLPHLLYLIPGASDALTFYEDIGISKYFFGLSIFYYVVVLYFIYQFYLRFKEISVLENTKTLMQKIIKTRKTVKHYVIFSLANAVLIFSIIILGIYLNNDITNVLPELGDQLNGISPEKLKISLIIGIGLFGLVFVAFLSLFYFILYGLLLRKLNRNYAELKNLQI